MVQARKGRDIQGIPWEKINIKRENYRQNRLTQYKNHGNVQFAEVSEKECKTTEKGRSYYEFRKNSRLKSTIFHFQLRNLVWATSKHDVYLMSDYSVLHQSSLTDTKSEVLNVSGHIAPTEEHSGSLMEGFMQTRVSTLAVKDNLLVAGGFHGELICKHLDRPGISYCTRTTYDYNGITNAVEIYTCSSGAVHFIASSNDCEVRDYDMENFKLFENWRFSWPVNHTSRSPDGNTLVIVGDDPVGILMDFRSGMTVASLHGHLDHSFASAWHPNGVTFATGNQDKTCRIWDTRNLSKSIATLKGKIGAVRSIRYTSDGRFMAMAESIATLKGKIGAVRSIRYTSDGRFMAMAESADFVSIFDAESEYEKEQEIDFFGEISGISFSPDTEALFIGVWDRSYGGLIEFRRRREYSYLDAVI